MITTALLAAASLVAGAIATFAGIGARVLESFHQHEWEDYCRRLGRQDVMDRILQALDRKALAAESLQWIATVTSLACATAAFWTEIDPRAAGGPTRFVLASLFAIALLLIFGSAVPWTVQRLGAIPFLFYTSRFWVLLSALGWPLWIGLEAVERLGRRLAAQPRSDEAEEEALEDEIMSIVAAGEREGLLESTARDMIEGVIELDDVTVGEIMTPRSRVDAVDVNTPWEELLSILASTQRSRYPVYRGTLDHVIGVLLVRDLLAHLKEGQPQLPLDRLMRQAIVVPDSKLADEMLRDFLQSRQHLAVVVDEYESVAGIVTIEDVLEEIVGEIRDEAEPTRPPEVVSVGPGIVEVPGNLHLDDLSEVLHLEFPETDEYDTVGGLLMMLHHRVPEVGENVVYAGARLTVLERQPRQVLRVRVARETPWTSSGPQTPDSSPSLADDSVPLESTGDPPR